MINQHKQDRRQQVPDHCGAVSDSGSVEPAARRRAAVNQLAAQEVNPLHESIEDESMLTLHVW
jgi:hypothetical protein